MSALAKKIAWVADVLMLAAILISSIFRDIGSERLYPADLRNRILGARLQKVGRSPYFYHWRPEDGLQYYDPLNGISPNVSNVTSTPFLHDLLIPICGLPQRSISIIWFILQYVMLAGMALFFICLARSRTEKWIVVHATFFFLLTEAWIDSVYCGQVYLFIAFLLSGTAFGLLRKPGRLNLVVAAIFASVLVLVRPTALVLFLPLLLFPKKSLDFLKASGGCLLIYGLFVLFHPKERAFWNDYRGALSDQVKVHQQMVDRHYPLTSFPPVNALEGFDFSTIRSYYRQHPATNHSENGNFFVLYQHIIHRTLPLPALGIIFFTILAGLLTAAFVRRQAQAFSWGSAVLLAMIFFMLADLFSPIHRQQYYTVQWFPLLLFAITVGRNIPAWIQCILIAGLLLNISNTNLIPIRHTVGEYLWLLSLILVAFAKPRPDWQR